MALLSVQRKREIEDQARGVFEQYRHLVENMCRDEVGPRGVLPVQTQLIVEKLYQVESRRVRGMPRASGLTTVGRYDGSEVLISEEQPAGARRFTEAHEIGHIQLHPGETHLRTRSGSPKPAKEHEAEYFAANLLMPRELVCEEFVDRFGSPFSAQEMDEDATYALTGGKITLWQIRKMNTNAFAEIVARARWFHGRHFDRLIETFGVSAQAMGWRLVELFLVEN